MGVTGWGGDVTLYVEIDFGQGIVETGTPAPPTGSAVWDGGVWGTDTWTGRSPVWTDVTDDVRGVQISSSFSRQTNRYNTSTASVTLDNTSGDYSVSNSAGPHYGHIGVLRQARIRAQHDYYGTVTSFSLFSGLIQTWTQSYPEVGQTAVVDVQLLGLESMLTNSTRFAQGSQGAGESAGARIRRILADAGWPAEDISADEGETTMQATTLEGSVMGELQLVADSEGGYLYWDADGIAIYDGYNAQVEKGRVTSPVEFTDYEWFSIPVQYRDIVFSYDGDLVRNFITYQNVGGEEQRVVSPNSRSLYGTRIDTRTDLIGQSDAHALRIANRDLQIFQNPELRVESITITGMAAANDYDGHRGWRVWSRLASGAFGLRHGARVVNTPKNEADPVSRLCFIESISHNIANDRSWDITLGFSSATAYENVGSSVWSGEAGSTAGYFDQSRWGW